MSDGVSINTGPSIHHGVLMELIGSSQSVAARVFAYQTAKQDAEQALAQLRLGQAAAAAYDDAAALAAQTQSLSESARRDADLAAAHLKEAQDKASAVMAEAHAKHQSMMAEVDAARNAHAQSVTAYTTEIKTQQFQLKRDQAAFEKDKEKVLAAASVAQAEAQKAKDAANAAEQDFRDRAEKLSAALAKISS
jgi:hypothetical protein